MRNSTTDTYEMKREIGRYSEKICESVEVKESRFCREMIYGILHSSNCILSKIADALKEPIKKINVVDRLSRNLMGPHSPIIGQNYLRQMKKMVPGDSTVYVDDSDVIKPYGKNFESLGIVRDGSSSTKKLEKGYHVTEITALTRHQKQPVSLYSHIHSSTEAQYVSANEETYKALRTAFDTLPDATYVFDRGYDMNDMFSFMYRNGKSFIIRITEKRKLFHKGKWYKATTLRDAHKGKLKSNVMFNGVLTECYVSCVNVQITESRRPLKLVLVYGLAETPMMLATNGEIKSKDDVIRVVRAYFSRWRIEEYFRFKKQHFRFEDFRVRSLGAINTLNLMVTYAIGFLVSIAEKRDTSALRGATIARAQALKARVSFLLYRLGLGVFRILAQAHTGIREWGIRRKSAFVQLEFDLIE